MGQEGAPHAGVEASLVEALGAAPHGMALLDRDLRFVWVNRALAAIHGSSPAEHLGRSLDDLWPEGRAARTQAVMREVLATGEPRLHLDLPAAAPGPGGFRVSFLPLSGAAPGEAALAALVEDVTPVRSAERRARLLGGCAVRLAAAATVDDVVEALLDVLVPEVAPRGAIGLVEAEGVRLAATRGYPEGAAVVEVGKVRPFDEARPMVDVALTGEALLLERSEVFAARYPTLDPARRALGDAAVATVPVRGEAGVEAVLQVSWPVELAVVPGDREMLDAVAAMTATALARIRAVARANDDVFRRALDAMVDDVVITRALRGADGSIVDFEFTHAVRRSPTDPRPRAPRRAGRRLTEVYPAVVRSGLFDRLVQVVEAGEPLVADELPIGEALPDAPIQGYMRIQAVPFGDGYLATTRNVTEQVALRDELLEARVLAEQERVAVDVLQQVALPTALPALGGVELAPAYLPATTDTPVGGDWYDVVATLDGRLVLVVGDVAGHGRAAAVQMVQARSLVHALASNGWPPAAVLGQVNRLLAQLWDGATFATCLLVSLDPVGGEAEVACAGHPPPILGAGGVAHPLEVPHGPPLGAVDDVTFDQTRLAIAPGGVLVLYTDGLVERRGCSIDDGIAEVAALVAGADGGAAGGAEALRDTIVGRVADARDDDVCLLVVRRPA